MAFHHVGKTGLELLMPCDLSPLGFPKLGITGVRHGARPKAVFKCQVILNQGTVRMKTEALRK